MSEKQKFSDRKKKLKENLYKLLRDEPEGIPKAFLWNQYHSKTKEPVAAHYYGVTKMHNLLEQFSDIFYETMHKGRATIRIIDGCSLDSSDSDDDYDTVQIPQISSTKSAERSSSSSTSLPPPQNRGEASASVQSQGVFQETTQNTQSRTVPMPATTQNTQSRTVPMPATSQSVMGKGPQPLMGVAGSTQSLFGQGPSFLGSPMGVQPVLVNVPFRAPVMMSPFAGIQTGLPSLLGFQTQQQQMPLINQQQQQITNQQVTPSPQQTPRSRSSSPWTNAAEKVVKLLDDSDDDSSVLSDFNYPSIKDSLEMSSKSKPARSASPKPENILIRFKNDIIKLLKENPAGIKKTIIWEKFRDRFNYLPSKSDVGVTKLTNILKVMDDSLEEVSDSHGNIVIKAREERQGSYTKLTWGKGAVALGQGQSLPSEGQGRSRSSSSTSLTSASNNHGSNTRQSTPRSMPSSTAANFIDLTDEGDERETVQAGRGRSLVDLTRDQQTSGFISLTSSTQPNGQARAMPAVTQSHSAASMSSSSSAQLGNVFGESVRKVGVKPISTEKFDHRDVRVTPVRLNPNQTTRTAQINEVAKECIELLANANQYVSDERIEQLLLQRCGMRDLRQLGFRYINQIPCVNDHNRILSKVNAYVDAFMRIRSISTLYELQECLVQFAPDKKDFGQLRVGPLQCLPVIYQYFKFPTDIAEVPEIMTADILDNLKKFLDKYDKWRERVDLQEFMTFMVEEYDVENAYILGVRIKSIALAIEVLKKSQRELSSNRREVTMIFKEELRQDVAKVFNKFRAAISQTGSDGQLEVRNHYLRLAPEVALAEIYDKFQLLLTSIEQPIRVHERKKFMKFVETINNFIMLNRQDPIGSRLFHLAICITNTELEEAALELLAPSQSATVSAETMEQKQPPAEALVTDHLRRYLEKCVSNGKLTLKMFDHIEEKLCEDFDFPHFGAMGFGRFLEFMLKQAKQILDECGGTTMGSGSGHHDNDGGYMPTHIDILEFIHQCKQCSIKQPQDLENVICEQFSVKEVKRLGHGNIGRLITSADKPGKHQSNDHTVVYTGAICGSKGTRARGSQTGLLGHQTRELALACLHNCPLLEDLAEWSQWNLVFEPQLGKLKDFIQKYGGIHTSNVEGGKRIMTTDIIALETKPGQLLKLVSQTSVKKFELALSSRNVRDTCGHMVSLMVMNKGFESTPVALLANHVKSALLTMHAEGSSQSTPGGPPGQDAVPDTAVNFVLDCLNILPSSVASVLSSQVFLDPLGQVVGSTKSKSLLLTSCKSVHERNCLQRLGCLLGVSEWTQQIQDKCHPPEGATEEIPQEEAEELFQDIEEIEESDDEAEISSISSFLSDDEEETNDTQDESLIVVDEVKMSEEEMELDTDQKEDKISSVVEVESELKSEKTEGETEGEHKKDEEDENEKKDQEEGQNDEDENLTEEEKLERSCQKLIDEIRHDEFGIGVELNDDGRRLMEVQQERLGRSLDRLSKDLYSKDTHFVLELVQNADDNSYAEELLADDTEVCPSVKFIMRTDGVIVLNNEKGFQEKDMRALCDVGRSTKGKHKAGYIGQKGIGFKSVFRVTDSPEVHSVGYHINFDVKSGPTGYILPHWIEDKWQVEEGWTTKIVLPLKEEMMAQMRSLAARFNDIHPSLLLFLHRLQQITIENQVEESVQTMRKRTLGKGVVEISHNDGKDRWLVVKKMLDATQISLQAKSGIEVESTEIALAFPLRPSGQKNLASYMPPKQPVFAFLPLRTYGFRFIIQGDFDVPSSREDVDKDSPWNQWIRNEIHTLFIEALENFKSLPDFKTIEAVTTFLQFVPVEDEILDFFRPVAAQILKMLKAKPCVPTQPNSKGASAWKIPSQTVTVRDPLILEVISPELLKSSLNLHYLHRDVAAILTPSLTQSLGIECLTTEHLLQIGKSLMSTWEKEEYADPSKQILMISKWLACIYRSLDEFHDNQHVFDELKQMRVICLASYRRVAVADGTVFFPLSDDSKPSRNDPMNILQQDLNTIHPLLVNTPDQEVNSQVQKLLLKIGVCNLSPREVISQHILPTLQSERVKEKSREILISYIIYIKEQMEQHGSLVNVEELASVAVVMTNHGMVNPKNVAVHFTPNYGNKIDLAQHLPGYNWILLDSVYIRNLKSQLEVQKWRQFFTSLGVTDSLAVRNRRVPLSEDLIKSSPWEPIADILRPFPEGCYIDDWYCEEIHHLITDNKCVVESFTQQLKNLYAILEKDWDSNFSHFTLTYFCDKDGRKVKEVETSFSIHLKTLSWIPAISTSVTMAEVNKISWVEKVEIMQPSCLYMRLPEILGLLGHTVMYMSVNVSPSSEFGKFLGFKYSVSQADIKKFVISWGERKNENEPAIFCTNIDHIKNVYCYIQQNFNQKDIQDLFDKNPIIFVPHENQMNVQYFPPEGHSPMSRVSPSAVAGHMLSRQEVWWSDPTGLFRRHRDIILEYHADIGKKWLLDSHYGESNDITDLFLRGGRIEKEPKVTEYGELLVLMSQVSSLSEKSILSDVLHLYVLIGEKVTVDEEVKSIKSLQAETEIKALKRMFKGQKIIATKRNTWASLEDEPLIADRKELEKLFQKQDGVHFVQREEKLQKRSRGMRSRAKEHSAISEETLKPFMDLCGIKMLSECVGVTNITPMFQPCPKLQYYVHLATPLVQRYLCANYSDIYQQQKDDNMVERLSKLQCVQVSELQVRYSLIGREPEISVIQDEKCIQDGNLIMFHKDYIESYGEINTELARFFTAHDKDGTVYLKSFLGELMPILKGESSESPDDILECHDCDPLPDDETPWQVEPPVMQVYVEPEPEVEPEYEQAEEYVADVAVTPAFEGGKEEDTTGGGMRAWPPMSDPTAPLRNRPLEPRRDDRPQESKVWPPPKAPDYIQSTKTLPSQFKIVSQEGEETAADDVVIRRDKQCTRQDSEGSMYPRSHEGTKRKSSEEQQMSEQERKRPSYPPGDEPIQGHDAQQSEDKSQQGPRRQDSTQSGGARQESDQSDFSWQDSGQSDQARQGSHEGGMSTGAPQQVEGDKHPSALDGYHGNKDGHPSEPQNYESTPDGKLGKRRHNTRESDSPPHPKKSALLMDDPVWGDLASEYVYEELGCGATLKHPPSEISLGQGSEKPEIGRWGEYLVYNYLQQQQTAYGDIVNIHWCNSDDETGNPYDFEVTVATDDGKEVIYIEVKSTLSDRKDLFEISAQQVDFARQVKERFHIYRVFNAGDMEKVRLVRIDNLSLRMDEKQVKLCMLI